LNNTLFTWRKKIQWEVHRNENNKYIITQPGFNSKLPGIGPVLMGWSLSSPSADYHGGKILFGVGYAELEIEPVGSSDHYFSIRVPDPSDTGVPHQVEFFIAERDHDVRASSFPVLFQLLTCF